MTNHHAVVIVGGGPTGLMLAAELALAAVDVALVERRATQVLPGSRAGGLNARTLEVLDQRGVVDRFLAAGKVMQVNGFGHNPLPLDGFPTRHPYGLALPQERFEPILADWAYSLAVTSYRGCDLASFVEDAAGVTLTLSDGRTLHADYLVGCDGGRSLVRKTAGIDFPGWDPSVSYLLAEGKMAAPPAFGMRFGARGVRGIGKLDETRVRVVLAEDEVKQGDTPALDELRATLVAIYGTDFGVHDVTWLTRFTDATRQAAQYRKGRVLLAGDAAHIHSPAGGQGLNLGVQDAVNLGWKLAEVVRGVSAATLLDTYHAERHPIGARVLQLTMAQTALNRGDDRTAALRTTVTDLFASPDTRRRFAAIMSGLDVAYDLGGTHPLVGRRMPDLDLETPSGPTRVYSLLHAARWVLLDLGTSERPPTPYTLVEARCPGPWELPGLGPVAAPSAVLIRPDGHVAWVGNSK